MTTAEAFNTMLLAAIGDIHGNLPALQTTLEAIDAAGIQTIVNTGDAVVGYPWPNEVIDLLRQRKIPSAQGEMDRLAAIFVRKGESLRERWSPAHFHALRWTYEHTRSENIEFLRSLPRRCDLRIEGIDTVVCHGTPAAQTDELLDTDDESRFLREREAAHARLIVSGRTHRPFYRSVEDTLFVNPGSVGMPPDEGPRASYAIIDTEAEEWTAQLVWVEYDFGPVLEGLAEAGLERP